MAKKTDGAALVRQQDGAASEAERAAFQAGAEDGEWWVREKASDREAERLCHWAESVVAADVDPFDPDHPFPSAYTPAEQVYFALSPKGEYGDRSAAKWFWEPMSGWAKHGKTETGSYYVRGFVLGVTGEEWS